MNNVAQERDACRSLNAKVNSSRNSADRNDEREEKRGSELTLFRKNETRYARLNEFVPFAKNGVSNH